MSCNHKHIATSGGSAAGGSVREHDNATASSGRDIWRSKRKEKGKKEKKRKELDMRPENAFGQAVSA